MFEMSDILDNLQTSVVHEPLRGETVFKVRLVHSMFLHCYESKMTVSREQLTQLSYVDQKKLELNIIDELRNNVLNALNKLPE